MTNQPPGRKLFLQPRPLAHDGRWLLFIFLTQEKPLRIRHAGQQVCTEYLLGVLRSYRVLPLQSMGAYDSGQDSQEPCQP